eukprot:GHVH01003017.1.p1 GENE.GHVH01003017.1~~GHVH01003017.1.p1  ORF type:complete len:281 (+),score=38.10 GHVH01003017.1:438-1280(+)
MVMGTTWPSTHRADPLSTDILDQPQTWRNYGWRYWHASLMDNFWHGGNMVAGTLAEPQDIVKLDSEKDDVPMSSRFNYQELEMKLDEIKLMIRDRQPLQRLFSRIGNTIASSIDVVKLIISQNLLAPAIPFPWRYSSDGAQLYDDVEAIVTKCYFRDEVLSAIDEAESKMGIHWLQKDTAYERLIKIQGICRPSKNCFSAFGESESLTFWPPVWVNGTLAIFTTITPYFATTPLQKYQLSDLPVMRAQVPHWFRHVNGCGPIHFIRCLGQVFLIRVRQDR